jgi:hypothetical protein
MDGMSPERLDAMLVLQASVEPLAPVEVAALVGKDRGSVKKLLRAMLADGQIVQPFRGSTTCRSVRLPTRSPSKPIRFPLPNRRGPGSRRARTPGRVA